MVSGVGLLKAASGIAGIDYSSRHTFFVSLGVTLVVVSIIGEFAYLTVATTCGSGQISGLAFVPLVGVISGVGFYWKGDKKMEGS